MSSKRYKNIEKVTEEMSVSDAMAEIKKQQSAKFDESIDVCIHLNLMKKHTVRDTVVFPHSFGKSKRVLVFAKGKKAEDAKDAGADFIGSEDIVKKIQDGWLDFDVAIATPDMMKDVAKVARILGSRGTHAFPKSQNGYSGCQRSNCFC